MSVQAIRLRNFRGFRDARIQLKPLTVLLGPNSAGKSAFGHALAALAHAHRVYRGTPEATLTPRGSTDGDAWPIDLGHTRDLQTSGTKGPIRIAIETSGGPMELGFGLPGSPNLLLSYVAHPSGEETSSPNIQSPGISIETTAAAHSDVVPIATQQTHVAPERMIEVRRINVNQWQEGRAPVFVLLDGLLVKTIQHESGTARVLSGQVRADVAALFERLTYLRATRRRPSRSYEQGEGRPQPIGYAGEWSPSILFERGDDLVRFSDPPPIARVSHGMRGLESTWQEKRQSLSAAVNAWLTKLGLAKTARSVRPRGEPRRLHMKVALAEQRARDITEIGFGVSQILPVLLAGLTQAEDSLFVVDLPEAHLHPRPQSELADFFCSLALSRRFCLVETHSEMFFHRLRLRAEAHQVLRENIAVYFIDKPDKGRCRAPRRVGLGFEDELHWPVGFFQEGWETEVRISSLRRTRKDSSG